jgi:DNA-binding CsgD family transcriptional regulator/extradiol dioxygenase family protein
MTRRGRPPAADLLTPAEWRVAEAVRHGLTNPQIAQRLGVSVDAIKYHVANALQKLGFARRQQLRRWNGIRRASALSNRETTMEATTTLGPLGQISRTVKDIAAAEQWYGQTLGLTHLYTFGKLAFFDCDGVRLFLSESSSESADSILYFRVQGIHAVSERLQGRGIEFLSAPHLIHTHADGSEEWMAFFKDNEGRPLALMEQVRR